LFAAISSGPRFFRICTVAPPALLVLTWHIQQAGDALKRAHSALWILVGIFIVSLPVNRQIQWRRTLPLPTGNTAFTDPGQWQELQWLQQQTLPGDIMFNNAGAILYLNLQNPMQVEFVGNDDFTSSQDVQRILNQMKKTPPRYIALIPGMASTVRDHSAPFREYVHSHDCLANSFRIGPDKYLEELWKPC
jgi:hypothetical protein